MMPRAAPPSPESREVELKLRVPDADLDRLITAQALAARLIRPARRRLLISTYFDTPDRRLRARGLVLRVRRSGRRRIQTLKGAPAGSQGVAADRLELEVAINGDTPELGAFASPLVRELTGLVLPGELRPVFETRVQRSEIVVAWPSPAEPEAVVAVAADRGEIRADGRRLALSELELELERGSGRALAALVEELRPLATLAIETRDKAARGWALAADEAPLASKAGRLALDPDQTVAQAFRGIGLACLNHWLANEAAAADGRDPEGVHQLRVALRRQRSALSLFRPVLPAAARDRLNTELRWLLGELGPARDRDVLAHELLAPLGEVPGLAPELASLRELLAQSRPSLYERVREALASRRAADLALDLVAWLELERFRETSDAEQRAALDQPVRPFAARTFDRRWRKARKLGRHFARLDGAARHELRIAVKKLRYGLDFFRSLWPESATRPFAGRLAELQDRLGHLNDVTVAEHLARQLVAEAGADRRAAGTALALGAMIGWHARGVRRLLREAHECWDAFVAEPPFWRDAL